MLNFSKHRITTPTQGRKGQDSSSIEGCQGSSEPGFRYIIDREHIPVKTFERGTTLHIMIEKQHSVIGENRSFCPVRVCTSHRRCPCPPSPLCYNTQR